MQQARPLHPRGEADAAALSLSLDRRRRQPLAVQLVRQLRGLVLAGRIAPGARLPSSRTLAVDLGVSRATVVLAFEQLASEGYLEGRHGSGMFVSAALPEQVLQVSAPAPAGARGGGRAGGRPAGGSAAKARRAALPPPEPARPFRMGAVDPALLPFADFARRFARIWRAPRTELTGAPDPFGLPALRIAIARHLEAWRGIVADPAAIVVTSGTADATELIARCALGPGSAAWVEEPGYRSFRHALEQHGVATIPVPVDGDGFDIAAAPRRACVRGAIVTPSRQFPLGATLPPARRLALLDWAQRSGGFVVEDDFDSEYRYEGTPLPALTSLDGDGRTIYVGSFSKTLLPALRLGFLVLPDRLVGPACDHLAARGVTASLMMQPVLAEYMASGDYATHIRRSRRVYARRLAALLATGRRLAGLLELAPTSAGMHVVATLGPRLAGLGDRRVAAIAQAAGIAVSPLSDYFAGPPTRQAVLLGFSGFAEPALVTAADSLARALARAA